MATRPIAGCRAIVTGASSGIGRALAARLVRDGASVLALARRPERLEELAREVAGLEGRLEILVGDVTQPAARQAALDRVAQQFGGLDLLVNNAGSGASGNFADASPQRLRQVMEVDFFAPAEFIRLALPLLRCGNRPMVVNVSSVLGHRGVPGCAEYCASKFALQGLSESLRAEFAPLGIDLLVVSPSTTRTEFFDKVLDAPPRQGPLKRGTTPDWVARRTVGAIRRGRHEIVISPGGKLLVWMSRLFPRITDAIIAGYSHRF